MAVPDRIRLEGLEVEAVVGVYPHEHLAPQRLILEVSVETNTREAGLTDTLGNTVDYDRIAQICRAVAAERLHLIEAFAERVAALVLALDGARVQRVWVRVAKPQAVPGARTVAVEIERGAP